MLGRSSPRGVPVAAADPPEALAARVQEMERALVVDVLADIAEGRLRLLQEADDGGRPTDRFSGPATPAAER